MITLVVGDPGNGKTSLMTKFLYDIYMKDGRRLWAMSRSEINGLNEDRLNPLAEPDRPPIFTNFGVRIHIGYEKFYEPYFVDAFHLGLQNDKINVQYIPPFSKLFIDEAQRFYNSRKSATMPDWVSRWFEMHRHYDADIYLGAQRGLLIDLNIRAITKRIIETQGMELIKAPSGRVIQCVWHTREFFKYTDYELYLQTGAENYTERDYVHNGDIFRLFNSQNYRASFIPDEKHDFILLDEKNKAAYPEFFGGTEPEQFRKV